MHCTARIVGVAWLVAAAACSDDGLTVQSQNSSSTGSIDSLGDSSGESPVSGGGEEQGGSASGGSGTGNTADPDGASSETGLPPSGTTDLSGTTGDGGVTEDGGTTEATTGSGTTGGASSSEGSTTGEACQPITEDPSGIGTNCRSALDCLPGYTCQPFQGFVFQQTCQILCTMECECPAGLACLEVADKSGAVWYQCG
jgi:hypothetical protein